MNILIVEDEVDLLEEYKTFLELNNHSVFLETEGDSALKTYFSKLDESPESIPFDIVILDYQWAGCYVHRGNRSILLFLYIQAAILFHDMYRNKFWQYLHGIFHIAALSLI